jgi:carbon starvation protein CstA
MSNLLQKQQIINNNANLEFESYKDLIMYYQTSIRNVALITTLSFAALVYSRFYRGKSKIYSVGMVFVSILIIITSFILNYHLYNSIQKYKNLQKTKQISNLELVNILFFIAHIIIILFAFYTLYRLITENTFKNE